MKISLLQKREPFEKILATTLSEFFYSKDKNNVTVKWNKDKRGNWLVNSHLNAIFSVRANEIVFSQIKKEFSRSLVCWKRLFQRQYVFFATNPQTAKIFATASLSISPQLLDEENIIIIGGNHHIRLLNYATNTAYVINKAGFNKQFLINELKVRQEHAYLPTPRVIDAASDKSWYAEELISGTPLNRLPDDRASRQALCNIQALLDALYKKTSQTTNSRDYLRSLRESIALAVTQSHLFSDEKRVFTAQFVQTVINTVERLSARKSILLTIAQTHGDFQPANILVNNEKTWLIDWEYTDLRQTCFDDFVFQFRTRTTDDWSTKFIHQYEQKKSDSSKQIKLLVFLLEELALKLKENSNQCFFKLDNGLNCYWREASKIIHFL